MEISWPRDQQPKLNFQNNLPRCTVCRAAGSIPAASTISFSTDPIRFPRKSLRGFTLRRVKNLQLNRTSTPPIHKSNKSVQQNRCICAERELWGCAKTWHGAFHHIFQYDSKLCVTLGIPRSNREFLRHSACKAI